jgi:parallel beta-helix repeat protein
MFLKRIFLFFSIFLIGAFVFPQISKAIDIDPAKIANYLALPQKDAENLIGGLLGILTEKWTDLISWAYSELADQAVLVTIRRTVRTKVLNYALFELPKEIGTSMVKAIYKIAVFVYSPDKTRQFVEEFEKKSVEEAKEEAVEWLLEKEIRVATGNLEVRYTYCFDSKQEIVFPYIIAYHPLDSKHGEVGIAIYCSERIEPPRAEGDPNSFVLNDFWFAPEWIAQGNKTLPPFIVQIRGEVEKKCEGEYKWIKNPTIEIEFPEYVPELEFKEPSWTDKIFERIEEQRQALDKIGEGLKSIGDKAKQKGQEIWNKSKEKAQDTWDWIKSTFDRYNPFGAHVAAPFGEPERIEITLPPAGKGGQEEILEPETAKKEEQEWQGQVLPEQEGSKESGNGGPEGFQESEEPEQKPKPDINQIQEQLDYISEQIDLISQRIAELAVESGQGFVLGETTEKQEKSDKETTEEEDKEEKEDSEQEPEPEDFVFCEKKSIEPARKNRVILNEVAWMGTKNSASDEWIELKNITTQPVDISGWQLLDKEKNIKIVFEPGTVIDASNFLLLERTDDDSVPFKTADFIYAGGLRNSDEVLYLFNESCGLEDEVGGWPDWPAGDSSEKRSMERGWDFFWHTFGRGCLQGVCGSPKAENSQAFDGGSGPDDGDDNGDGGSGGGSIQPPHYWCSQENLAVPASLPLIINEVAWMGTQNSSEDEWIELKNVSGEEVVLTGWQLLDKDLQIKILFTSSNVIEPGGFLLLERTNDDSVPNVSADKIYFGVLNNQDESLRLFDGNCNLIDEVMADPDWPAGDNAEKKTMERSQNLDWHTFSGQPEDTILGTPKKENSAPPPAPPPQPPPIPQSVVINEIAWMGTEADLNGEWIELYNNTDNMINLSGWTLQAEDGVPEIDLTGIIFGKYFYLLERTQDDTVSNILANQIYTGALGNEGEILELRDSQGNLIDKVDCSAGWFAGDNDQKITMERIDPQGSGSDLNNWTNNNGLTKNGFDASNHPINGTPRSQNSSWPVLPQIRYVPDGYPTIQNAINASNDGDTIIVKDGTYTASIVINKAITIQSENGAAATIVQGASDVFSITADGVEIRGFTITGGIGYGIKINSSHNIIRENDINSNIVGILVAENREHNTIEQNTISQNQRIGVHLDHSSNNMVSQNDVSENSIAGVHVSGSQNQVYENNISNNFNGLFLSGDLATGNVIYDNQINLNTNHGIHLSYARENTITENNVKSNGVYGINFWCSGDDRFFLNNFENEQNIHYGLYEGCGQPAPNIWNSESEMAYTYNGTLFTSFLGNYWNDYEPILEEGEELDADSNGVGDYPHPVSGPPGRDDYPLLLPFENYQ